MLEICIGLDNLLLILSFIARKDSEWLDIARNLSNVSCHQSDYAVVLASWISVVLPWNWLSSLRHTMKPPAKANFQSHS